MSMLVGILIRFSWNLVQQHYWTMRVIYWIMLPLDRFSYFSCGQSTAWIKLSVGISDRWYQRARPVFLTLSVFSSDMMILDKVLIISAISLFSSKPTTDLAEKLKLLLWKISTLKAFCCLLLFPWNPALNNTVLLIGFRWSNCKWIKADSFERNC